jgi:hypothetical protein
MKPDELRPGPIRHETLPPSVALRAETVQSVLAEVFPTSREEWIDSLKRDLNPEAEVLWWERVAGCYVQFTAKRDLPLKLKQSAFKIIFGLLSGVRPEGIIRRDGRILAPGAKRAWGHTAKIVRAVNASQAIIF